MGMLKRVMMALLLNLIFSVLLFGQNTLTQCKATLTGDTLVLENNIIKRVYNWNNGNLKSYSLTDKRTGYSWKLAGKTPDQLFPGAGNASNGKLTVTQVNATPISVAFLKAEVEVKLGALEVKKAFRIYPDCPAIACDYYLKGNLKAQWTGATASKGDLKNIETNISAAVPTGVSIMETLALPGKHWNIKTTQFFDITDQNNTLVQEHEQLLYRSESRIAGNVLFAEETGGTHGIFILKEAPSSDVQLAYPGADFLVQIGKVQAIGVGVNPADLSPDKWTRCYGFVTGVTTGDRLGQLSALRNYQQQVRLHQSGRDDMVMMNTRATATRTNILAKHLP
ncbi:hypothetical protein [Mucilaginibacter humi]|uniref:hypothetical protein n=1 Tax=Mucilaginibacter humi TaxID=2732510 RepID=UPI001C2E0F46|nr:hypothetical protein [Mucilaginibacter humi]